MKLQFDQPIHVSYCTNVHPGESWAETFANITNHVSRVKERICPDQPFGIGLRLSNPASLELARPEVLEDFKNYLGAHGFYVFTINGFPYGNFHGTVIKENVFAPDWISPSRLAYTNRLADILVQLLPDDCIEGSISTLPGSLKEWITSLDQSDRMIGNLARCAYHLEELSVRSGKNLHLGLEPEPMGYMETTQELVDFFQAPLPEIGSEVLARELGITRDEAASIIRRRLGMCYDTCHMAVEYESAFEGIERLRNAGVLISKIQVSSALRLGSDEFSLRELERFSEGVYLHQVIARDKDSRLTRWKDIPYALADRQALSQAEELRVHCHVPLFMTHHRGLESTSDFIPDVLRALAGQKLVAHFELETYTWDVLPPELRQPSISDAIVKEFQWFLPRLAAVDYDPPPTS